MTRRGGRGFRATGVTGRRDSTCFQNILIRYLNRSVEIGGRLEVGSSCKVLFLYRDGTALSFRIPEPVRAFLAAFDSGGYPDLVQPPSKKP